MQVDSTNFQQHIDLILQEIQTAHFVAFDCQFTGLVTQTNRIQGLYPDHIEFYERIKETALNFNILQLGITLFHYEAGQYFPKSYNFYVAANHKRNFNKVFLSEWESLKFLSNNHMDFTQVFKYGIPYKRICEKMPEEISFDPLQDKTYNANVFFSKKDRELIEEIEKDMKKEQTIRIDFKTKRIFDHFRHKYDMSFDKGKKGNLDKFQYNCKIYPPQEEDFFEKESKEDMEKYMDVCKKVEDINLQEKMIDQPHEKRTLDAIIDKIIKCNKPLVGHFPNLDLGLIYQAFIADLPNTYQEFTDHINQLFPYFFDTKVISRRLQSKIKSIKVDLKSLYLSCFSKKGLQPYSNINFKHVQKYMKSQSNHEAGYDSFMTGCAFIAMMNCLYEVKKEMFVFSKAADINCILYSRFAGEVSLLGPQFTPKTAEYSRTIVVFPGPKSSHNYEQMGERLSAYGTLSVVEDHQETYYVFDQPQNTEQILLEVQNLRSYSQRAIVRGRRLFG